MDRSGELARKIYSQKIIDKTDKKIKLLGVSTKMDAIRFLNIRLFTSFIVFFVVLYIFNFGYLLAPLITIIYYYLIEVLVLNSRVKKRASKLEGESMHLFEVLTLSIETGRNLEEAIKVTIDNVESELAEEFKEAIREVSFGKSLTESLNDMQENIPSESINNFILTLTQADIFGSSIIDTLNSQVDYLREKRKLEIKAEISKVPIKISIISVLFFVPLIILIIIGPALLTYIK